MLGRNSLEVEIQFDVSILQRSLGEYHQFAFYFLLLMSFLFFF